MAELLNENELTEVSGGTLFKTRCFRYVVKKNDSLGKIASKYHTTVAEILRINTSIKNADLISADQTILVPWNGDF